MVDLVNFDYAPVDYEHVTDFRMQFRAVTRPWGTWAEELGRTVQSISLSSSRPLLLCMGGGIDSEVVARAMLKQGIKFTVLTLKHTDHANAHDTHWADLFCQEHELEQICPSIDTHWFFAQRVPEYQAQGFVSRRPWRYFQMHLIDVAESLGGTGIICSGDQMYRTHNNQVCSVFSSEHVMALEYCRRQNIVHFPYLHLHNSELLAAYMKTDLIELLLNNPDYFRSTKFNTNLEKVLVYHRFYPEMTRRDKVDGFENCPIYHNFIRMGRIKYPGFVDHLTPVNHLRQQLGIN